MIKNIHDGTHSQYSGIHKDPYSKVHGTNMGTTWVLSAPDGAHVGPHEPCYQGIRDHGPCGTGTHKEVNNFEFLLFAFLYHLSEERCIKLHINIYICSLMHLSSLLHIYVCVYMFSQKDSGCPALLGWQATQSNQEICTAPAIILWMYQANERSRHNVTSSFIGWAHPKKEPCCPSQQLVTRANSGQHLMNSEDSPPGSCAK